MPKPRHADRSRADANFANGWYNLAQALAARARVLEALDAASRAGVACAGAADYNGFKAQLEASMGAAERAQATLESALVRAPGDAVLRFQLAALLEENGALVPAADAYEQVTRLDPAQGAALSQLLFLRQRLADWHDLPELRRRFETGVANAMPLLSPFVLLSNGTSRAVQRRCADAWTAALAAPARESPQRLLSQPRLRVGYLSADFHTHATAFLAAGLFEAHDRRRFEIVGYSTGPDDRSPMRARLARAFDRFVDMAGWSTARIAHAIRADGIDILVDLKGHTEGAAPSALALRPAPIQVHYLGYPGTLGGRLVDYLVGDAIVTPPAHAADYAEALALLRAATRSTTGSVRSPIRHRARHSTCRATPSCCAASTASTSSIPRCSTRGAASSRRCPPRCLWLMVRDHDHPGVGHLRREAVRRGIDARRLVFATARPNPEYLGLYRHADLFLDTWPYNAPHHRERCAVGGVPGRDVARGNVRRSRGREPAARGRAAGARERGRRGLRHGRCAPGARSRRARAAADVPGRSGPREPVVRHRRDDARAGSGVRGDGGSVSAPRARADTDRRGLISRESPPARPRRA
jgi:predicted O-linked N-acetylglucosamine transferase (SPINDLY family)